jgi:hypothetical protein
MAASDAILLMNTVTWGSAVGIPVSVSVRNEATFLAVRGEAVIGPTARGRYLGDIMANVRWLVGAPAAIGGTPASLVCTFRKMDGSTAVTITATLMTPSSYDFSMDRDSPPGSYGQDFIHVGSMASDPVSVG